MERVGSLEKFSNKLAKLPELTVSRGTDLYTDQLASGLSNASPTL